ncbi:MAG: carbon storage regulator [Oscillospiraceae bacterium]
MLVVSRKLEESILIELGEGTEPIEIKILAIDNQVRIGINAPKGCKIWRNELYKTIEANRRAAETGSVGNIRSLTKIVGETKND